MLNADIFGKAGLFYKKQFEYILSKITECHRLMLEKYSAIENDENKIRNRLHKDFLDDNAIREKLGLVPYLFDIEHPEIDDEYSEKGRTDIKVYNAITRTKNTEAYYVIECKRLNGSMGLNRKYIQEGIQRFQTKKYPSYYLLNGMIGFIVKLINIKQGIAEINELIEKDYPELNSQALLTKEIFIDNFEDSYISIHLYSTGNKFKLYHLLFDFSELIEA